MPTAVKLDDLIADFTKEELAEADPLDLAGQGGFRWGQFQVIPYDRAREDLFGRGLLTTLYDRCEKSGRAKQGILPQLFCGLKDLSHDNVTGYLATLPLMILGEWRKHYYEDPNDWSKPREAFETFTALGFMFLPSLSIVTDPSRLTPNSAFGAYAFFQESWKTPAQSVLSWLGLAYLFRQFRLQYLHGTRYQTNHLTARWLRQFGFQDCGFLPAYLYHSHTAALENAILSFLSRKDFADLFRRVLVQCGKEATPSGTGVNQGPVEAPPPP